MKILITGGSGFIGSHLVNKLVNEGNEVVVLDNLDSGKVDNLKKYQGKANFKFVKGDITKKEDVRRVMNDVEKVYHLAAMVGVKHYVKNPKKVIQVNVKGTENLLEESSNVKKFLFTSTSEVYGRNTQMPLREDSDRVLGDTSVDRWCYSTAKALDEHLCFAYYRENGVPISIVRYFNVYGPKADTSDYSSVIPIFIRRILNEKSPQVHGDGKQTRCFTFVKDIVEGTILAADKSVGEVFNLGTEKETNILQLAQILLRLMGSNLKPEFMSYEHALKLRKFWDGNLKSVWRKDLD
jgi:UDP-glucose 4-epimerase